MPQSLSFVLVHLIFSTKDRLPLIHGDVRDDLHAYLATVVRNLGGECYRVGGVADHVHLAVRLPCTAALAEVIRETKACSSKWIKARVPGFAWQRGYGAFSVSPADRQALIEYIASQKEHYRKHSFQEEFRAFLRRYGVVFDERYVWD